MLRLAAPTRPDWLPGALGDLDTLLLDHAHCEKKAASTAINLIFRYSHRPILMRPLSELAREELEHFERVLGWLERRGVAFRRLSPAPYAARLHGEVARTEPDRLLDTLLCSALIEARSCERMGLLAAGLRGVESELSTFYDSLLASEARHHAAYVDLCLELFDAAAVRERLGVLALAEARVIEVGGAGDGVRFHS